MKYQNLVYNIILLFGIGITESGFTSTHNYQWPQRGTFGGLYSTSNQQNANQVNPIVGTPACPRGYSAMRVLLLNANSPYSGQPDQFSVFQCLSGYSQDSYSGLYSTSNVHNADIINPITGEANCPRGARASVALAVNTPNLITGQPDQVYLFQCVSFHRQSRFGGLYSFSNQQNTNKVNPMTGTLGCPTGYNDSLMLVLNADNTATGQQDQFFVHQCWK